ncbi:fluoride efflux transporter CrcB [Flavobacterium urocaniciphilum]|uniref:Fluoride-specific ion channel FluC n=1 Tax=Flavobacterium urocaniciphilum TaxID=1299341 RepID=A0A1H8YSZ2_9FLAO|nr:fluoride efflux transporter CrcB [Flavobacterium urocaniciphilum]SEP55141.1 CrcB protein [Flavobacterium urocaniciphilum]
MIKNILLVLLGGGIGSVARYLLSYFFSKNEATQFPWATFIANTIGCLLIGLLFGYIQKNNLQNETLKLILITGFCGGFTTFSTFSLENIQFIQNQNYNLAILYTISSLVIGLLAVIIGIKIFN